MEREPVVGLEQVARNHPLGLVAEVDQVWVGHRRILIEIAGPVDGLVAQTFQPRSQRPLFATPSWDMFGRLGGSGPRGRPEKCGLEVGDEVVDRLDPDREADERRRGGERRVRGRRVRHRRRAPRSGSRRRRGSPRASRSSSRPTIAFASSGDEAMKETIPPKPDICRAASSWPGMAGEPRIEHLLDRWCAVEELGDRAGRSRSGAASAGRASSARAGRASESKGPGTAPSEFCRKARRSAIVGSFVAAKPPTTSEWPPRYFVVEWTTMSAPSSSGRWRYGVAKVLSTTTTAPAACAASATARDVDDAQQRVRRRLEPDEPRALVDRLGDRRPSVDELEVVALRRVDLVEEAVGAAVDVVHRDNVVARERRGA